MRIRTIKPDFWLNERIAKLPEKTQLVAIALLNYADDEGYFYANPDVIRGQLFPFHEDSRRITVALTELSKLDYLRISKSKDGREYGFIVNFKTHQRVNNATPSKLKGLAVFTEDSRNTNVVLPEDSLLEGKGMEGEQGSGTGNEAAPPAVTAEQIYDCYPKKAGRQTALVEIKKAMKGKSAEYLLERVKLYAEAVSKWPNGDIQYAPDPERWFKRGKYDDDPMTWERNDSHGSGVKPMTWNRP